MTASKLIAELQSVVAAHGDMEVSISCAKQDVGDQTYLISEPTFAVVEEHEDRKEVMLRDWPY